MAERTPDDAEWERLVASLRGPDSTGDTDWPEAENVAEDDEPLPSDESATPPRRSNEPVIIWRGSSEDVDAELERAVPDEHFVPPDPPPLPRADALTWAAWIAVIGAPLVLLAATALGVSSRLVVAVCAAGFLAGIGVLITRMRTQRDPYDPNDGAVV
jgi:hypothetical protein